MPSAVMPTASVERYNAPVSMTPRSEICSRQILIIVELKARTYFARSCSGFELLPFIGIISEIGVFIDGYLKIGASAAGEEIPVNFSKGDARVKVDARLFEFCFLQNQNRHHLPEQFAHGFHARVTSLHALGGVAHGEEHSLDSACPWRVVEFGVAVGYIRNAAEIVGGLQSARASSKPSRPLTRSNTKFSERANLVLERASRGRVISSASAGNAQHGASSPVARATAFASFEELRK